MARTESVMLPLGTSMPPWQLPRVEDGQVLSSSQLPSQPVLVMFLAVHCPFVKHVEPELARLDRDYKGRVSLVGIGSNSVQTHPEDGPEYMVVQKQRLGMELHYLHDADQAVAKAFRAACTPDFFLFDANHALVYRGQLDGSRPGNGMSCDGADLRAALDAVLTDQPVAARQRPSVGCNIKWHPGAEPAWFG
ncbi:thioredoxin family protein [Candidatus Synechococcus spongiarum]|uniref:thioredoxin family protein n=1 Tax=Candidatus Synechococcus spongiarum TaxID=431041 RepID=UPI001FD5A52A|nr:thioredoxin family protein [Candidatus Synechococcus spongiarum]